MSLTINMLSFWERSERRTGKTHSIPNLGRWTLASPEGEPRKTLREPTSPPYFGVRLRASNPLP